MRINSLDGLRAIAILSVLLHHHEFFNNGWMGVDLFFVLSGFLITQVLRRARLEHSYWKRFYIKRATRIMPPMALTVLLALIFTHGATPLVALGYLLSLGGILEITHHSIYALGPLWSLAIEEHFYLAWPFAVRFLRRGTLIAILIFIVVETSALRGIYPHPKAMSHLTAIYFLTPFRIDEMAMGCLLAILMESQRALAFLNASAGWLLLASVTLYLGLWQYLHHIYFFPGAHTVFFDSFGYSLLGLVCFSLVAYVRLNPASLLSRGLAFRPLAFIGRISYGIYLYHLLIKNLVMWSTGITSQRTALLIDFPIVLLASWFSFTYYEQPLIEWGRRRADALTAPAPAKATVESIEAEALQV